MPGGHPISFNGIAFVPFGVRSNSLAGNKSSQSTSLCLRTRQFPVARARNPGGFAKPPVIPSDLQELKRAIGLLGNATQRRPTPVLEKKLTQLVGKVPDNRLIAQQWKGSLTLILKDRTGRRSTSYAAGTKIHFDELVLPEDDSRKDRAFSLLETCRRKYILGESLQEGAIRELRSIICFAPRSADESAKAIRTLSRLSRLRRSKERRPVLIPERENDLQRAYCLLGLVAQGRSLGRQKAKLRELLGSLPRTKNVARWWKKQLGYIIRKRKRKWEVAQRRLRVELLRTERRAKKERRAEQGRRAEQEQRAEKRQREQSNVCRLRLALSRLSFGRKKTFW